MAVLKYKDSNGNYQSLVGINVQCEVVQTTGTSTTAVMSQKAVTDYVQSVTINPIDVSTLSVESTFSVNDAIGIDGIIYRAKVATEDFPFTPVVDEDGNFCIEVINGETTIAIVDDTLSEDWEVYLDCRNEYKHEQIRSNFAYSGGGFGTCATAGSTAAKTVYIKNFHLCENAPVSILFTNGFTASNPMLNISGTGAKAIYLYGSAIPMGKVRNNTVLTMVYANGVWNVTSIESIQPSSGDAVDLGLPSGVLWCSHNVGADSPEKAGLYFSWGNVEGHAEGSGYNFDQTTYNSTSGAALTGNIAVGNTYDTARHNMGAPWRMPTVSDFAELISNCVLEYITQNGVIGKRFTSRFNGNSIFLPASGSYDGTQLLSKGTSGLYWSSLFASSSKAYCAYFASVSTYPEYNLNRYYGFTIRAVQ